MDDKTKSAMLAAEGLREIHHPTPDQWRIIALADALTASQAALKAEGARSMMEHAEVHRLSEECERLRGAIEKAGVYTCNCLGGYGICYLHGVNLPAESEEATDAGI